MYRLLALTLLAATTLNACASKESEVFDAPADNWDARARRLPLNERYAAFEYGVMHMHPAIVLADPMADGGSGTAKLLLDKNQERPTDAMILASADIYERMKVRGIWSICESPDYRRARLQGALIKSSTSRALYASRISSICPNITTPSRFMTARPPRH